MTWVNEVYKYGLERELKRSALRAETLVLSTWEVCVRRRLVERYEREGSNVDLLRAVGSAKGWKQGRVFDLTLKGEFTDSRTADAEKFRKKLFLPAEIGRCILGFLIDLK